MPSLSLSDLSFRYRRNADTVVSHLDLDLSEGRVVLLGPNGAGKSTLLALASTALRPQEGRVSLGDVDPWRRGGLAAFRRRVAWMPQATRAHSGLSAREQVAMHGWLKGMGKDSAWTAAVRALERVALSDQVDTRATTLSGGQRARLGLAQALVHDAEVLLLDEPTAAMDPAQRVRFSTVVSELSSGRVVLTSTHDVADLEDSYDRVLVMAQGDLRFDGTMPQFLSHGDVPSAAYLAVAGPGDL